VRGAEDELARVQEGGSESARLEAARAAQHARDALEEAQLRVARAQTERTRYLGIIRRSFRAEP